MGQADVANIRAGLERSPHHAARAIDDAFARLDPNSDTARAARRELTADNSDGDGVTITARPDGTFLVRDADGNEIGTAKDAEDVSVLAQKETPPPGASAIQSTTDGGSETTDPSNTPSGGNTISRPLEAYNRRKHYGRTPTAADRRALGAGQREVVDHYPSLVDRYYEADPSIDEPPGYMMTPDERKKSAKDRSRMARQSREDSDAQGAEKARYSKNQKRKYEL